MNYGNLFTLNHILSFLVHVGYLTYHQNKVFMPNQEIKYEWKSCSFFVTDAGVVDIAFQQDLIKILRAKSFNSETLERLMTSKLPSLSYFDTITENSYHMYVLGLFGAVFGSMVSSNRESGHGRYDIAIALEDIQRLFIFEFKVSDTMKNLNDDAKIALKQIKEKKYYEDERYRQWRCFVLGISFYGKEMSRIEYEEFYI
jgi:hypothetical protein